MQTLVKGTLPELSKSYYDLDIMPSSSHINLGTLSASQYLERYKGWVFSCVSVIATSVACLSKQVSRNGKKVEDHNVASLVTFDVLEAVVSFLKLSGKAYIWKVQAGKEVMALRVLRPDKVTPEYSVNGSRVLRYVYHNGTIKATFKPDELIVINNFSPKGGAFGDIQAAAIAIDTDNAASVWNRKFFENDASAGTVLQTTQKMNKDQLERIETKRLNKHKGVNNRGKLAILHGGLQIANANPSQKEMDFVQQRGLSRDEILAIFKVPKAMLGMGEGVNVWNVRAFSVIFAKNVILPLTIKISEAITADLLPDGEVFEFTGVVPANKDQARQDWLSRAISLNEYRRIIGEEPRPGGDNIFYGDDLYGSDSVDEPEPTLPEKGKKSLSVNKNILDNNKNGAGSEFADAIVKAALSKIDGTEEALEARRGTIIKRMDKHEETYKKAMVKIFNRQRKDIMDYLDTLDEDSKAVKDLKPPTWGKTKYLSLWLSLMRKPQKQLIEVEGAAAIKEVDSNATFTLEAPAYNKWADHNLKVLATGVDLYTANQVSTIILKAEENGVSIRQLKTQMANMFKDLTTKRINTIVRTETIKLGSYAQDQARQQSGVVDEKQRYTAIDERVCPYCNDMHGKRIKLGGTFFDKGDNLVVPGATPMQLNYEDIKWPPLHPNCRCTLLPVIKDIDDA